MATDKVSESKTSTSILELFPRQGNWQESDYFALPEGRIVELVHGRVEVPAVPSLLHQFLVQLIFLQLHEHVTRSHQGRVMTAPTRVKITTGHYREPDVLYVGPDNVRRRHEQYWDAIDLAVEVISPDDPDRDLIAKRRDYASANIPEYWIVDPRDDSVLVLQLHSGTYRETNLESKHRVACSAVLKGCCVDVVELFRWARQM